MPLQTKIECYLDTDQIYYFLIEYIKYHFALQGFIIWRTEQVVWKKAKIYLSKSKPVVCWSTFLPL